MPTPPIQRKILNHVKLQACPVPIADSVNMRPARIKRRLRPKRSDSMPDITAPNRHPTSALLMAQPCMTLLPEIPKNGS